MAITHIRIKNLRIIEDLEIEPSPGINLFHGGNGSGKTTILEAIYLLGRGKSFRKSDHNQLTRNGEKHLTLFAKAKNGNAKYALGMIKSNTVTQARINSQNVSRMSDLARAVPLTIITPNSHEILERGPQYRRKFLDWGVFHVEHDFREAYERFSRALKQRNALIRTKKRTDQAWDRELIDTGTTVNQYREKYFEDISKRFLSIATEMLGIDEIETTWSKGWPDSSDLEQHLVSSKRGDLQTGYTRYGPHRADMSIKLNGKQVDKVASRGQQKMLVAAMHLAQVEVAREKSGTETIVLIDDLTSELDRKNRNILLQHLQNTGNQVFISGVDDISDSCPYFSGVFHVEQGKAS